MSILSSLLPIAASFIPGVGPIAGPALGALMNAGSGGGGYAGQLAGALTAQRMPGQTQAGEYTPQAGGFGTYNYIPTGATQIDPALIQQILGLGSMNQGSIGTASPINSQLLSSVMGNPYYGNMMGAANSAGQYAANSVPQLQGLQNLLAGNASDIYGSALNGVGIYERLMNQAGSNPYGSSYLSGANNIGQGLVNTGGNITDTATGALSGAQGITQQLLTNPYSGQAQAGANTGGQMLQGAGQTQYGQGGALGASAMGGLGAGNQVLQTAFDPQGDLYKKALGDTQDQLGTQLARMGITDSGTGARLASDTLRDFNLDWQDRQLGRQSQGLQSYGQNLQSSGGAMTTGGNLQSGGADTYARGGMMPYSTYQAMGSTNLDTLRQLGTLAQLTGSTAANAGNMMMGGNAAGYDAYNGALQNQLGFADAYTQNGLGGLRSAYGAVGNAVSPTMNAMSGGVNMLQGAGSIPYSSYMQGYGDQFGALQNFLSGASGMSNLGTASINPMQGYLGGVMTGANNAASAAGGAQTATTNQNAQAAAGLTPMIQAGLQGLSGLFGNMFGNSNTIAPGGGTSPGNYGYVW